MIALANQENFRVAGIAFTDARGRRHYSGPHHERLFVSYTCGHTLLEDQTAWDREPQDYSTARSWRRCPACISLLKPLDNP